MMYDDNAFDLNSDQFFPEGDEPSNQEEVAEEAPAAPPVLVSAPASQSWHAASVSVLAPAFPYVPGVQRSPVHVDMFDSSE